MTLSWTCIVLERSRRYIRHCEPIRTRHGLSRRRTVRAPHIILAMSRRSRLAMKQTMTTRNQSHRIIVPNNIHSFRSQFWDLFCFASRTRLIWTGYPTTFVHYSAESKYIVLALICACLVRRAYAKTVRTVCSPWTHTASQRLEDGGLG